MEINSTIAFFNAHVWPIAGPFVTAIILGFVACQGVISWREHTREYGKYPARRIK